MSRTGLLFLFCLLMLCSCAHITEFMGNTESQWRWQESLAAEKGRRYGSAWRNAGWKLYGNGWCTGFRHEKMTGMDGKEYIPAQGVVSSVIILRK